MVLIRSHIRKIAIDSWLKKTPIEEIIMRKMSLISDDIGKLEGKRQVLLRRLVMKQTDYTDQCYCHVTDDGNLKARCLAKGHCIFTKPITEHFAQQAKDKKTLVGVLTDYFAGRTNREIRSRWGVSGGYIYKKLARIGVSSRPSAKVDNQLRGIGQAVTRKLIPYAGKEQDK